MAIEIVSFPIQNDVFPYFWDGVPEGNPNSNPVYVYLQPFQQQSHMFTACFFPWSQQQSYVSLPERSRVTIANH